MGRRGPPPKPKSLKKAQGTYQKCRDSSESTPNPTLGAPQMPAKMKGAARRRWLEVAPELLRIGMLTTVDGGALEAYCRSYARWLKLEGMAEDSPIGDAATEARKLQKEVIRPLEIALGLDYAARNRLKLPEKPKEQDEVEKFLFKVVNGGKVEPPKIIPPDGISREVTE